MNAHPQRMTLGRPETTLTRRSSEGRALTRRLVRRDPRWRVGLMYARPDRGQMISLPAGRLSYGLLIVNILRVATQRQVLNAAPPQPNQEFPVPGCSFPGKAILADGDFWSATAAHFG